MTWQQCLPQVPRQVCIQVACYSFHRMALQVTCVPYVGTLGTPICQPPRHLVRYASSLYSRSHQSSLKPQATAYGLSTNIGQSGWSSYLPNHLRTLAVRQLRSCLREKWKRPGRSLCLSILTNLLSIPLVLLTCHYHHHHYIYSFHSTREQDE